MENKNVNTTQVEISDEIIQKYSEEQKLLSKKNLINLKKFKQFEKFNECKNELKKKFKNYLDAIDEVLRVEKKLENLDKIKSTTKDISNFERIIQIAKDRSNSAKQSLNHWAKEYKKLLIIKNGSAEDIQRLYLFEQDDFNNQNAILDSFWIIRLLFFRKNGFLQEALYDSNIYIRIEANIFFNLNFDILEEVCKEEIFEIPKICLGFEKNLDIKGKKESVYNKLYDVSEYNIDDFYLEDLKEIKAQKLGISERILFYQENGFPDSAATDSSEAIRKAFFDCDLNHNDKRAAEDSSALIRYKYFLRNNFLISDKDILSDTYLSGRQRYEDQRYTYFSLFNHRCTHFSRYSIEKDEDERIKTLNKYLQYNIKDAQDICEAILKKKSEDSTFCVMLYFLGIKAEYFLLD